eukprot:m.232830 g.232830  ORF g.232830 m.232830 type:complete len:213 (-) comp19284_c0_seq4:2112-2750(-)
MDSKRRRVNRGSSVENPSASTLPRTPASSSLALLRGRTNPSWKEFVQGPSARTAAAAPRYSGGGGDDMDKSDGGCASHSATMQRQREQIASMSQDMKELKAQLILADAARVKHDADMSAITVQLQRYGLSLNTNTLCNSRTTLYVFDGTAIPRFCGCKFRVLGCLPCVEQKSRSSMSKKRVRLISKLSANVLPSLNDNVRFLRREKSVSEKN